MTLKHEELLSRYFERKMSSQEEQNFLISVAANDELRLAFRSHLELMKAVGQDKDAIRSTAQVRARTLAALGLSTLAIDEFVEHDILSRSEEPAPVQQASMSPVSAFTRSPFVTVLGGIAIGFLGALTVLDIGPSVEPQSTPQVVSRPAEQTVQPAPQTYSEPIPQVVPEASQEFTAAPSIERAARSQRKAPVETNTTKNGLEKMANSPSEPPVVNVQEPGTIAIKPSIRKPDSSEQAK